MVHFAARLSAAEGAPPLLSLQGLPGTFVRGVGGLLNCVFLMTGATSASICTNSVDSSPSKPPNMSAKVSFMRSRADDDCNCATCCFKPSWLNVTKLFPLSHGSSQRSKVSFSVSTKLFFASQSVIVRMVVITAMSSSMMALRSFIQQRWCYTHMCPGLAGQHTEGPGEDRDLPSKGMQGPTTGHCQASSWSSGPCLIVLINTIHVWFHNVAWCGKCLLLLDRMLSKTHSSEGHLQNSWG